MSLKEIKSKGDTDHHRNRDSTVFLWTVSSEMQGTDNIFALLFCKLFMVFFSSNLYSLISLFPDGIITFQNFKYSTLMVWLVLFIL